MDNEVKTKLDQAYEHDLAKARENIKQEEAHKLALSGLAVGSDNFNNRLDQKIAEREEKEQTEQTMQNLHYGQLGGIEEVERQNQEWQAQQEEQARIQEQEQEQKRQAQELQDRQTEEIREQETAIQSQEAEKEKQSKEQEQTDREEQVENIVEQGEIDREETTKENLRNEFSSINQGSPSIQNEISSPDALKQEIAEQEHEAAKSEIWEDFKKANKGIDRDDPER